MSETISWIATVATVIAASMTAANLGPRVTGYGFVVFTLGALCWIATGVLDGQPALTWTNVILVVLDVFGVWRWLGRQAKVEEGGRSAAAASEDTPGETLFPVSILARAEVACGNAVAGHCVDAMAGCRSGRLDYLVVSCGGVGGVGETLHRLAWRDAYVDGERVIAGLTRDQLERLPELPKDAWPGR